MSRRRRERETTEFLDMIRRLLRTAARRVADADEWELHELLALQEDLQDAIATAVRGQRELHGRSWADIARATGTTRQAAQARWGTKASA